MQDLVEDVKYLLLLVSHSSHLRLLLLLLRECLIQHFIPSTLEIGTGRKHRGGEFCEYILRLLYRFPHEVLLLFQKSLIVLIRHH